MIATIILADGHPAVPLPAHAVAGLGLRPGQRVRVELQALPRTPRLESDGTPA